jgi:uncharacterized protein
MWPRLLSDKIVYLAGQFPAVLILGGRQVGKTTLAKLTFPDAEYCDLESVNIRTLFNDDPEFQLTKYGDRQVILDEAQVLPQIFPVLRGIIDTRRAERGRFIILGSAQPSLIRSVSESLAGRVGVIELDPLTAKEISRGKPTLDYHDLWLKGGFPDSLKGDYRIWWESYLRTFVERDLAIWNISTDPVLTRRLLTMLAHQQGGLFNASALGKALGISYHTVNRYVRIFEGAFLIRRLPPYHRNIGKRLIKSPKVYLRDTGLLHHLLNISDHSELNSHPILGISWETLVVEDVIRREKINSPHSQFYFWRTQAGAEIDLIIDRGSKRFAIEIKTGTGLKIANLSNLNQAISDVDAESAWIINQGTVEDQVSPKVHRKGFESIIDRLPGID